MNSFKNLHNYPNVLSCMTMANNMKMSVASRVQFDKTDPLWNETPKMGVEGLIGTIEDRHELLQKLVQVSEYNKQMKRGIVEAKSLLIQMKSR